MPSGHYRRLSGLDTSFLVLESANTYMHIALTGVFERGSLVGPDGGLAMDRLRAYVASRLHLIPRYRQRLARIALTGEPIWVDDARFDLGYHVRHTSLPRPGSDAQLRALCGRILERHLDRARPLWEMWAIEGMADGRFALLAKVHHCMVDGIGGVGLLAALFTPEPASHVDPPVPWTPRPAPRELALARDETVRRLRDAASAIADAGRAVTSPRRLAAVARARAAGTRELLRTGLAQRRRAPFVGKTGPHRRIEWFTSDLAVMKRLKHALGGTVNDVVLATVTGAARAFIEHRGGDRRAITVRAGVPVSVRSQGKPEADGNHVAAWIVPLPIAEPDALRRLGDVRATTAELKRTHLADTTEALTRMAEWANTNALGVALRLLYRARPYDVIVTNVPGPPCPLYMLDARLVRAYPHLPLFDGQGLSIALFSYDGTLSWGLGGDWDLMPDLDVFTAAIERSLAELERAAGRHVLRDAAVPDHGVSRATSPRKRSVVATVKPAAALRLSPGVSNE